MSGFDPLIRFFEALDATAERVERTWWGTVVTDARFPQVWDTNQASIDRGQPDLSLAEVERALLPAVTEAGIRYAHVVVFDPGGTGRLVAETERRGDQMHFETVMQHFGRILPASGGHAVREEDELNPRFWEQLERAFLEFDIRDKEVREQMTRRERDVLTPFGKRWFTVKGNGDFVGFGALYVRDGVGYLDNVITLPHARRRGIASAIVMRMIEEARAAEADSVYLLSDQSDAIRLYQALGFREVGRIASSFRPL